MNKIIPFNKDITFNDTIGEIESIALDDNLSFANPYTIKGDLTIRGTRKNNDIIEDFSYPLPVEIAVDDKYNTEKATINVDDFYYEIINDNILKVKIDLILDNLFYKEEESNDIIEIPNNIEVNMENNIKDDNNQVDVIDLFKETKDNEEKEYSLYRVYLFSDSDTLEDILNKYKVTKEELEELNDLTSLKPGVKIIIPSADE